MRWPWWGLAILGLVVLWNGHIRFAEWVWEDRVWLATPAAPFTFGARALTRWTWPWTQAPWQAHTLSLSLHMLTMGLLAWLARQLRYSSEAVILVAVIAAVHPLTVETIAYAAARSELIAAAGVMLAVGCAAGPWWRPWRLVGMCLGLVLGWLGKDTAIVCLGLIPVTIWVQWLRWRDQVPLGAPVLLLVGVWVLGVGAVSIMGLDLAEIARIGNAPGMTTTWDGWLLPQAAAAYREIGATVSLRGFTVDADIDVIPMWQQIAAVAGLAGLGVGAWWGVRSRALASYGLLWCLCGILPRLLVQTPRGYFNDHQFYLPFFGLVLAGVAWWDQRAISNRGV